MLINVDITAVSPLTYLIYLIICTFACLRLSALIVFDDGPFDLIFMFRAWMGVYRKGQSGVADSTIGRLFGCPHCIGLWVAALIVLLVFNISLLSPFIWLAVAGGQSWLESMRGHRDS